MLTDSELQAARERLSALADGELEGGSVALACIQWRESAESQATWHAYQLIGDALRSDDLASDPAHDAGFLAAFRARLATEPVVLAPQALERTSHGTLNGALVASMPRRSLWSWGAPSAVAAGFVAVAGVVMLLRTPEPISDQASVGNPAQALPVRGQVQMAAAPVQLPRMAGSTEGQSLVANGQLIRDAGLDRYLEAHKQFAGSSALGVPSGFLRSATTIGSSER